MVNTSAKPRPAVMGSGDRHRSWREASSEIAVVKAEVRTIEEAFRNLTNDANARRPTDEMVRKRDKHLLQMRLLE
jgi:hypothetical protein